MTTTAAITLRQKNDETIFLTVVDHASSAPLDLTGATLECYIKPSEKTDDDDPTVVKLTSTDGDITVTSPAAGQATVSVPATALADATDRFWRTDVIISSKRKTVCYGKVTVIDL